MKKVSVIIPVYNAQEYLVRCLGNLVNQTLQDIEIILVNDLSTDGSLDIMKECQKQFPDKIVIINMTEKGGPGGARNKGVQAARGEYIGFVDSDDIVVPTMFEKLYEKAVSEQSDIVDCGYYFEKEDTAIIHTSDDLTGKLDAEKRSKLIVSGGYIWSKLFRAELLQNDPNYSFRENAILEDSDFLTYAFATADTMSNVKELLYQYSYHPHTTSESNTQDPNKYYNNIKNAIEAIYHKTKDLAVYDQVKEAVEYEIVQLYLYGMINCLQNIENKQFHAEEKMLELKNSKDHMVQIPYDKNIYIKEKITGDNWSLLKKL